MSKPWNVVFDNSDDVMPLTFLGDTAYLTRDGCWGPSELAVEWTDKKGAEDVAAALVVANPGRYLGRLEVRRADRP